MYILAYPTALLILTLINCFNMGCSNFDQSISGEDITVLRGHIAWQDDASIKQSYAFVWKQSPDFIKIHMPVLGGLGYIILVANEHSASISSPTKQEEYTSLESLMASNFGWSVSYTDIRHWILGLRAPGSPAQHKFDNKNRLIQITNPYSTVDLLDYCLIDGHQRPGKLVISSGQTKVEINIDQWL